MARIPEIIRRNPLSQVAAEPVQSGFGWGALANLAEAGAQFIKPKAVEQVQEQGLNAVYRDASGTLKVEKKSVLGGEFADIHNTAAFAKYLAQRKIDMGQTFTELAQKYEFDPAGFKEATDGYVKLLREDETIPSALKEDLLLSAQGEANARFNGLYSAETHRNQKDADTNTSVLRQTLADDYVNLYMAGDIKAAEEKLAEITELSRFRANAPYIRETPAETDAYMRGLRASAKVAKLTQRMTETSGATTIPEDLQQEIDAVLNDPDLDPDTRRKLYAVTQGRLKEVDANAIVAGLSDSGYEAKVRRAESGGNPNAKNPASSATGLHQFTEGTWLENVNQLRKSGGAAWANGLSDAEILEMRKDPTASTEVFNYFTENNQSTLAKVGLPVNDATSYMAHFFGVGGAIQVLQADPSAMVADILPDAVKANPFLTNMTARDAYNWAARKMTVKASDIASQQSNIDMIEDTEVKAIAMRALNDRFNTQKRMEDEAASGYGDRLLYDDPSLTAQEIMEDNSLSDQAQKSLVAELQKRRQDQIDLSKTIADLNNPETRWDQYDTGTRKELNTAYESMLDKDAPLSERGQMLAGEIAVKTGYLPQASFNAIRGAVNGTDPAALASSMEFLNQVIQRQPGALNGIDGSESVLSALSDYSALSSSMDANAAASQMIADRSPEMKAKRKNLSDAAKAASKDLKSVDVMNFFGARGADVEIPEGAEGSIMTAYKDAFERAFIDTENPELASRRALNELARTYGPNEVTGSKTLMKFPPQNFYYHSVTQPDWMQRQIRDEITRYAYGDDAFKSIIGDDGQTLSDQAKRVEVEDIFLTSDETTRKEVAAGMPPTYQVMYRDEDGLLQMVAGRYKFDPTAVMAQDSVAGDQRAKDFEAARQRRIDFEKNVVPNFGKLKGASLTGYPNQ